MNCKYCGKGNTIKKGIRKKTQRYLCKECKRYFQENYTYRAYAVNLDVLIKQLLKEGCGIRSISRILNISCGTVLSRMLKISAQIKPPDFSKPGCTFEIDELWSFTGSKKRIAWITYALERNSGQIIAFFVGSKSKENIKPLIDRLLILKPKHIYTDKLNIYPALIPKEIHRVFRYCTNIIERKNLTLRTHIKRLSRKTICFSKNKRHLEAHLRIYFWG